MNAAIRPSLNDDGFKNSLIVSGIIHLMALLLLYFGLPHLMPPIPDYHPQVPFEIVEIADITNTRVNQPQEQTQPAPPPPKPQPKQEQVQMPTPPKEAEPKPPEPKAEALKSIEKPKPPDAKTQQDFTKLLKNLEVKKDTTPKVTSPETKADSKTTAQAASQAPSLSNRLTISEEDLLRRQIEQCWNPPIGAKDAASLVVEVTIDVNSDRIVTNADIVDKSRYASDPFFRAAADAAKRAVLNPQCSPLQLPPDKYDQWKHIDFTFDPRDAL